MTSSPHTLKALSVLEEIKATVQSQHELDPATRASMVAKISKLRDAVETPLESVLRILAQPMQNAALRVAVELGILSKLAEKPESALNPNELANNPVDRTGSATSKIVKEGDFNNLDAQESVAGDPQLIVRLMRVLTAVGVCDEVGPQSYRANYVTKTLAQEGFSNGVKFLFDCEIATLTKLIEFLRSTHFTNPANSVKSAFGYAFGAPKFEWLRNNPESSAQFDSFMAGRRQGLNQGSWMDFYPIEANLINGADLGEQDTFCVDVGGGRGHDLESLHDRFPTIGKLVLQDQEKVVASSTVFEPMVHDFFGPQPIKGARVYHLRAILHDWPTAECRTILSHIAAAMKPDYSRLIIRDFVLPETGAPLLGSCNDLRMMVLLAGMERTEKQWIELLSSVGLDIVGIWILLMGGEGVIEAVKKTQHSEANPCLGT